MLDRLPRETRLSLDALKLRGDEGDYRRKAGDHRPAQGNRAMGYRALNVVEAS